MKKGLLTILILCFSTKCYLQDSLLNRSVSIVSPTAASIAKYGDIPVSTNTGIPSISIPIHSLRNGDLSLNIGLSYHASGVKVLDQASNVGLGWSLQAGGVISRSIQGAPDDKYGGQLGSTEKGHYNNYGFNNYLYGIANSQQIPSGTTDWTEPWGDTQLKRGIYDAEPDIFTYNFCGYSGKFYFNDDRTPVFTEGIDLKIYPSFQDSLFMNGFIITTPDGNRYYFGKSMNGTLDAYEKSCAMSYWNGILWNPAISSWFLTKIENYNKSSSIEFEYQSDKFSYYSMAFNAIFSNAVAPEEIVDSKVVKIVVDGVRLKKVTSNGTVVEFIEDVNPRLDLSAFHMSDFSDIANQNSKPIGEIRINNQQNFCKSYKLKFSYFEDNNTVIPSKLIYPVSNSSTIISINSDRKKLRLDEVQESDCSNTIVIPSHKFSYYPETVSRTLSFSQDHWGFNNGVQNTQMLPSYLEDNRNNVSGGGALLKIEGADRNSKWPQMRGGALKEIAYPTGGKTILDFEANDTYVESSNFQLQGFASGNIGYDGSNPLVKYFSIVLPQSNTYKISFNSSRYGSIAYLQIYKGSQLVTTLDLQTNNNNQVSTSVDIFLLADTYTFKLQKDCYLSIPGQSGSTGIGAEFNVNSFITVPIRSNVLVGGLRVKKITDFDSFGLSTITNYRYDLDEFFNSDVQKSSGIVYSRPMYVGLYRNSILAQTGFLNTPPSMLNGCMSLDYSVVKHTYFKSPSSIIPLSTFSGSHIGYKRVIVSKANNGSTIFEYNPGETYSNGTPIFTDIVKTASPCDPTAPDYPAPPDAFEPHRGLLTKETVKNEAGIVLNTKEYTTYFSENTLTTPGIKYSGLGNYQVFTPYNLISYKKYQEVITETNFDNNKSLQNITNTYWDNPLHSQPTRTEYLDSKDNSVKIEYMNCLDLNFYNSIAPDDGISQYNYEVANANAIYYTQLNSCSNPTYNCKWLAFQQWRRSINIARTRLISTRITNYTSTNSTLNQQYQNLINSCSNSAKAIITAARDGFLLPIQTIKKLNDFVMSGTMSEYKIENNNIVAEKACQLETNGPAFDFQQLTYENYQLISDSRFKWKKKYLFDNDRLVQIEGSDGAISSYYWSYNNSLPVIQASNINYTNLVAGINGDIQNNTIPSEINITNALSSIKSTYPSFIGKGLVYELGLGLKKEMDSNNNALNYVYDLLGRVIAIKDKNNHIVKAFDYKYQVNAAQ